jgi:hypothetical protein
MPLVSPRTATNSAHFYWARFLLGLMQLLSMDRNAVQDELTQKLSKLVVACFQKQILFLDLVNSILDHENYIECILSDFRSLGHFLNCFGNLYYLTFDIFLFLISYFLFTRVSFCGALLGLGFKK